jgi:hypothetical protein
MTDDFKKVLSKAIMQEANSMVTIGSIPPYTLAEVHSRINSDIVDREIFSKMDSLTNGSFRMKRADLEKIGIRIDLPTEV